MANQNIVIMWFRQDLRLKDNPALIEAAKTGNVLPIYILDDEHSGSHCMGGASRWWLHQSLNSLNESLDGQLRLFKGPADDVINALVDQLNPSAVFWNRCYEPWRIQRDKKIKKNLESLKIHCESFNGSLLWEPWEVLKKDGTPYKVFTPFFKKGCLMAMPPNTPLKQPRNLELSSAKVNCVKLNDLGLMPDKDWYHMLEPHWQVGEDGAKKRLNQFLKQGIKQYKKGRDFPSLNAVSRLSPYLHFGEISPHTVWYAVKELPQSENRDHFLSEMGWREFSYSLLYHFPKLPTDNLQPKFDKFPWRKSKKALTAWQKGQTGIPIVDAGMRELWQTGYMHNRVRMIVGSFLVKNLLLHWHHGERWFWDCLLDADLANNSASWQWVAGCGADAAPYFRIFNPVTQGEKFDPEGEYMLKYVPELKKIPKKYLFNPWDAPKEELISAGIQLGKDYPHPIVDLKISRQEALDAFASLSKSE